MKIKSIYCSIIAMMFLLSCAYQTPKPSGPKTPALESESALFQRAETLYEQGNYDLAIQAYSQYMSRYPKGTMIDAVLLKLGISYGQMNMNEKALISFNDLINRFPNSPLVIDSRIETLAIFLKQGRFNAIEQASKEILQKPLQDTQKSRLNGILGDCYAAAGDPVKAVKYYDEMLKLVSSSARKDVFDRVQSVVDRLDEAQTNQLLEKLPDGGVRDHLLFHLGNLNLARKNIVEAEAIFGELLLKYPDFIKKDSVSRTLTSIVSGEFFKPFTIGCLLPLSGAYSAYGQRALQGIEMAIIHFSQETPDLIPKLVVEDTHSDPEQAKVALEKMAKEGVAGIIGPIATAEQIAMEADALGIPIITLTQKEYITDSGPFIFRNFITPEMQVKALVNYAAESLKAKRFAILYPQENYGVEFMDIFWDEVVVHNGMVVGVESYNPENTDFADPIKKLVGLYYPMSQDVRDQALAQAASIRNPEEAMQLYALQGDGAGEEANPDTITDLEQDAPTPPKKPEGPESIVDFNAIFIPDSPKKVGLIIPQLAYYDIRDGVHFLGTNIWHSDVLIRMSRKYLGDAVIVDGFFAESQDQIIRNFVSSFSETYNQKPEIISATAYDSALIILYMLKDPSIELRSQLKDRLLTMPPYKGVTGLTTFRPNGDVSKDLFILGIKNDRFFELTRLNPYPAHHEVSTIPNNLNSSAATGEAIGKKTE